ncbi:major facilitator superfamily domain-containing protein [Rhodotorula diobovata]|uniref:Major facilitator superfamily domain-containing protein n=1 Tax=Rhodotorula diobovata TaxID=5288 RepID=A0A5C5G589_9BASI|nr:major facilitator superfamily domain-containing protein [Rhodotorula diobovata]
MTAHEGVEPVRARTDSDATIAPGDAPVDHDLKLKAADEAADLEGSTAVGGKKGLRFWLVFACLLLATFNAAVEQTAISTALPTIADDLNGSDYAWIANVFMICSAAVIPWSGGLAYILGRRPVFYGGLGLFSVGSVICAVAQDMTTMLAGRGVQGAGAGVTFALVEVILSDLVPLKERGVYQGAFSATWSVASAVGPLLGGAFASFNWRWLFALNALLAIPCFVITAAFMKLRGPEGNWRDKLAKMDWIGNLIFIPSISVLILGIVWGGETHPWRSAPVIATIVCGAVGLVLWFVVERHWVKHPTVPFEAMMNRTSLVGFFSTFLHGVVAMGVYYYWPAYFQSAKATTTIGSAVDFLPVVLVVSPMAMLSGIIISVTQSYKTINVLGWVAMTVGPGLLTLTTATTSTAGWVLIPMVSALGIGILYAASVFPILAPLPPSIAGQALSFQMLVRTFGNVLGISIGATTMTNVLAKKLPQAYLDIVPGGTAGAYSSIPLIRGLEEPLKMQVREAFAQSLRVVWIVMIPFAGLGFLVALLMKSLPLNSTVDENFGVKAKKLDSVDSLEKADREQLASTRENPQQLPLPMAEVTARSD